ncbi:MAG TPA: polysaccharide deacetylase family protein, partial [Trueperaceae bacterium]|nr:polysaccharide deacetylase family protein [Trueperaceae bacterium]
AKLVSLMYHDVLRGDDHRESGFESDGAALYKVSMVDFRRHLQALWDTGRQAPREIRGARGASFTHAPRSTRRGSAFALTFDDGGKSAITVIAPLLESLGWRGHFFVATDMIGQPTFLSADEVLELHRRGHVIGSHSASHPERMSTLAPLEQYEEWRRSLTALNKILGAGVRVASVPNGFYSVDVARAAAAAGVRVLFTSEPTVRAAKIDGCLVLGRYSVQARTSEAAAAALLGRSPVDRLKQTYSWKVKKMAKSVAGESYLAVRARLLRRGT